MSRTAQTDGIVLDLAKIDSLLSAIEKTRNELAAHLGLRKGTLSTRFSRAFKWARSEVILIATFLDVSPTEIELHKAPVTKGSPRGGRGHRYEPSIWVASDITALYETLNKHDFVLIFSMDGFIEANDRPWNHEFYSTVLSAIQRGVQVTYLFPDSDFASQSTADFEKIARRMHDALDPVEFSRVRGYFLNSAKNFLCTKVNRFVVFGTETEGRQRHPNRLFLYICSHRGREAHEEYWIELNKDREHLAFITDLANAADPIEYYPKPEWEAWRLPDNVRKSYRSSFDRDGSIYNTVRNLSETQRAVDRLFTKIDKHFQRETPTVLRWLDIGCHNGYNTGELHRLLTNRGYTVSLTAIEPSIQRENDIHDVLRYSAFLNAPQWSLENFCETLPLSMKYDLITCIHSWYVIEPIYLVLAYRRLSDSGMMMLTSSPYRGTAYDKTKPQGSGNFINAIAGTVDQILLQELGWSPGAYCYTEKEIVEDPFRTYAEDIDLAMRVLFGGEGECYHCEKHAWTIDAASILADNGLTTTAKDIAMLFVHNIDRVKVDEHLFSASRNRLEMLFEDGKLPVCEWDFCVDRAEILRRRGPELFFSSPPRWHSP